MAESLLFARYRLLEPTGMGGTAAVWRAIDESTDDEVAVKRLHPALLADEATRVRLVREFGALRKLDHPRVVRVRDLELGRTDAALVLDYVPGRSLAVRLLDGPVSPADAVRLVSDVASALDAAHAAGILHRDVKPGNILLRDDGAALLTDFGIVGSLDDAEEITAVGTIVGTFRYMSPQRLAGAPATASDDIYALGVVAWQALAGRPPFDAPTPVGVAERVAAGPPPLEGVPRAVDGAIRRAIAVDPAERYPDASSFARTLSGAFGVVGWTEEPLTEPWTAVMAPAGAARFAGVAGDRSKGGVPAAVGALLVGLVVLAVLASSSTGDADPSGRPPPVTPAPSAAPTPAGDAGPSVGGGEAAGKDKGGKGNGRGRGKKHD